MLTCAAILRHINYSYADYGPMRSWIARLSELFKTGPSFPSAGIELQVMAGFLASVTLAMPIDVDKLTSAKQAGTVAQMREPKQ